MFKGYTLFIVIVNYWLYPLCCTIYPIAYFVISYFIIACASTGPILNKGKEVRLTALPTANFTSLSNSKTNICNHLSFIFTSLAVVLILAGGIA